MGRFDFLESQLNKPDTEVKQQSVQVYDAGYYYQLADKSFKEGNYESALKSYSQSLGENPNFVDAWVGEVRCLIELNELNEARTWVNKGIELFPESAELLASKSWVLAKTYEFDDAMKLSDKAITKRDPAVYVWLSRGYVLLYSDDKNAKHCFTKVVETNNKDWFIHLSIGCCYLEHTKFSDAKYYLDKTVQLNSTNPLAWYKLGLCNEGLKYFGHAEYCYTQCLRYNPSFRKEVAGVLNNLQKKGVVSKIIAKLLQLLRV